MIATTEMNSFKFDNNNNDKKLPEIIFYYTDSTVQRGKSKIDSLETTQCKKIEDVLLTGKHNNYMMAVLLPYFKQIKLKADEKNKPATFVFKTTDGKIIDSLIGVNTNVNDLVNSMFKTLKQDNVKIEKPNLENMANIIKNIGNLIDKKDALEKEKNGFEEQLKTSKNKTIIKQRLDQIIPKLQLATKELEKSQNAIKPLKG